MGLATREAYGKALAQLGGENKNIVVLDADLSKSTKTAEFKETYPERFINIGIAEGNMMSVAAGLSATGKVVFASSFAIFAAGRAFEQVRNSIAYPRLNVKICATHAGISVGEDGASHQSVEDLALMRSVPNMVVVSPCDGKETQEAIRAVAAYEGPCYVRLGRLAVDDVNTDPDYKFELGKAVQLEDGEDVTIIATGLMVQEALKAAKVLRQEGIGARVLNIHTLKPLDKEAIWKAAKETKAIVTCEEHNYIGGLYGAVCEALCEGDSPSVRVARVALEDTFGESGNPKALLEKYGLTSAHIVEKVKSVQRV